MLVGQGGTDMFWQASTATSDVGRGEERRVQEVAETYGKLRGLRRSGQPGPQLERRHRLVIQGKAGMQFMGDWAKGEFTAAGQTAGKEYGCTVLAKGSAMSMGGDVFVFPKTEGSRPALKAQVKLAKVLLEPETQIAFNKKKGSIPVRLDVDVSSHGRLRAEGGRS